MMAKGEIARFEQFLFLSPCFQKAICCSPVSEKVCMRERVNTIINLTPCHNVLKVLCRICIKVGLQVGKGLNNHSKLTEKQINQIFKLNKLIKSITQKLS